MIRTVTLETNEKLYLRYIPEYWLSEKEFDERINDGMIYIKQVFFIDKLTEYEKLYEQEEFVGIRVVIGNKEGDFYKLDKRIFDIENDFYIEVGIRLSAEMFIIDGRISIIKHIDKIMHGPFFLTEKTVKSDVQSINVTTYQQLIKKFPTSTEILKYKNMRIAGVLEEYFDGLGNYAIEYENYLAKRNKTNDFEIPYLLNNIELFEVARDTIVGMLSDRVLESNWQKIIAEIIRLIYPQYVICLREVEIATDDRHKKKPDFIMVDASGYADVIEIKSPQVSCMVSSSQYRYNYVADHEMAGAIVQIEKYLYCMNRDARKAAEKIGERIRQEYKQDMDVKVINPRGILILGRSNSLTKEQKDDLELIKRQYKNVVDIMSYDDLVARFENIIWQLRVREIRVGKRKE